MPNMCIFPFHFVPQFPHIQEIHVKKVKTVPCTRQLPNKY